MVGAAGFAPASSRSQAERRTSRLHSKNDADAGVAPTSALAYETGRNLVLPAWKLAEARGCAPRFVVFGRAITRSA